MFLIADFQMEEVEGGNLFFVVILHCIFESLLKPREGLVHFCRPPDLGATQRHLGGEVKQPFVTRLVLVADDGFGHLVANCDDHHVQHVVEPVLHLLTSRATR